MKKTKLDELLKSGAVTEEEYKELLPTCEDDAGEPDGAGPDPEDPLAGLDEKTRAAVEKMLQSERDRAANRVGNAKKKELEDSKRQYEELKTALEELKKAKLTEDERKELERKEAADVFPARAGVILFITDSALAFSRFPRTRGGDPLRCRRSLESRDP